MSNEDLDTHALVKGEIARVVGTLNQLREAYHRAGVPEYWLVDARSEEIPFQILYRRKRGYVAAPVPGGWQASRVFGRSFRMRRRRDESGLWEYTLEVRAESEQ